MQGGDEEGRAGESQIPGREGEAQGSQDGMRAAYILQQVFGIAALAGVAAAMWWSVRSLMAEFRENEGSASGDEEHTQTGR